MVSYQSLCVYWKWPRFLRRYQLFTVLFGAFFVHLSLGSMYTLGNMVPYVVSYIRNQSEPDLRSDFAPFITACQSIGQGVMMIFGGYLESRIGPRLATLFGSWLLSAGILLTAFSIQIHFVCVLITYGLMVGFGAGIAYISPIACVMRWMPKWKALGTGIVVSGFGLSATIFTAIQTAYINPSNLKTDKHGYFTDQELLKHVPHIFLILGSTYAVMQLIGCVFIVNPPPDDLSDFLSQDVFSSTNSSRMTINALDLANQTIPERTSRKDSINSTSFQSSRSSSVLSDAEAPLLGSVNTRTTTVSRSWSRNIVYNIKPQIMLCKINFYLLWVMFMLAGIPVAFIASLYKQFGLDEHMDDHFLAIVGSVSAIFNLFGRILWGILADVMTYNVALVLQVGTVTILLLTWYITSVAGQWFFLFWVCGLFFCIGGTFSIFPAAVARGFGQVYVGMNYGLLYTSQTVGAIVTAVLSYTVLATVTDNAQFYWIMFFILAGLSFLELLFAMCFRHKSYILLQKPDTLHSAAAARSESTIKFPDE